MRVNELKIKIFNWKSMQQQKLEKNTKVFIGILYLVDNTFWQLELY